MSSNESKSAQTSLNETKWAEMGPKDPKCIQNDLIWAQNRPKRVHMSKPKYAEKCLHELKWASMSSNSNKNFTSDAYPV